MHILFLSHYFPPEVNAPATRTFEHCREWVKAGHRVTVITCAPNCPNGIVYDGYRNAWKSRETVDGIDVVRVWTWIAPNSGFVRRVVNFVSYMLMATFYAITLRNVDVVIATSPQFFCGWAGVLCHWFRRWPFVLEIRDIWPESIVTVGAMKRTFLIRLLEWFERKMYAAADHIVTVGEGYRQKLLERGVSTEKISVVPNGVDLSQYELPEQADAVDQQHLDRSADCFVCSYVGTVGMAHGLEVVLDAAELARQQGHDNFLFQIVGDGAERQRLEQAAKLRGLTNVRFTGMLPKSQIVKILAESDACLVHLKGTELFSTVIPSKIFEMMAMNVPIIMGVRGQACDIVQSARAGLEMTPDDPASLLSCLEQIQVEQNAYHNGRRYVEQHFNRRQLANRMLEILLSNTVQQNQADHQADIIDSISNEPDSMESLPSIDDEQKTAA